MTDPRPTAVALLGAGESMADAEGGTERRPLWPSVPGDTEVEALPDTGAGLPGDGRRHPLGSRGSRGVAERSGQTLRLGSVG